MMSPLQAVLQLPCPAVTICSSLLTSRSCYCRVLRAPPVIRRDKCQCHCLQSWQQHHLVGGIPSLVRCALLYQHLPQG